MLKISDKIGQLVATNRLDKALSILGDILSESRYVREIIMYSSQYNDLKNKIRLGVINLEDENVSLNKIRIAILELADEINDLSIEDGIANQEISDILKNSSAVTNIIQNHYGKGDNVGNDKIVNS